MKRKAKPEPRTPIPILGAHMSIAGGTPRAIERAEKVRCTALQIFVKNASRWTAPEISEQESAEFRKLRGESRLRSVLAHDSYLINLASPDQDLWNRSILALCDELGRSEKLGLDFLVAHPGAHLKSGENEGIRRISQAIDLIHQKTVGFSVKIALETTAGQGSNLGYRFEQLRDMISGCQHPEKLAVCLDTCHVFAAGYDIRDEECYQQTLQSFDETIGLERLAVIHLNDSKRELGSRVDRHNHIGHGQIGERAFKLIMNDRRMAFIPKILETPKGDDDSWDGKNLRKLESLLEAEA